MKDAWLSLLIEINLSGVPIVFYFDVLQILELDLCLIHRCPIQGVLRVKNVTIGFRHDQVYRGLVCISALVKLVSQVQRWPVVPVLAIFNNMGG